MFEKKEKITYAGQPCRKCNNPVVLKVANEKSTAKRKEKGGSFYFKSFFKCNKCKTFYFIESEKVYFKEDWREKKMTAEFEMKQASDELEKSY